MNILFLDQATDPGGAQLALLDVLEEVRRCGWNARVMAPGSGALVERAGQLGVPVHALHLRPLTNGRKTLADLLHYGADLPAARRQIRQIPADVVYINGPRVLPAATGLSVPVIFHSHSYINGFFPRALAINALRRTGATVISASRFVAKQFRRNDVRVIYNGSPDLRCTRNDAGAVRIGMVGRIAPEKGCLDFVRACRLLATENATFTIFGAADFADSEYKHRVQELACSSRVRIERWREDVATCYRELDILAVPSSSIEASTRVIMEAFSAGVAVVAYPSGGIPELINHGRTGLLTSTADPVALAHDLRVLIRNAELREQLTYSARLEWQQRFTKRAFQQSVCDVIASMMKDRGRAVGPAARYHPDRTLPAEPVLH